MSIPTSVDTTVHIRTAIAADWPEIWLIFHAVVRAGDTYSFAPETTEGQARQLWLEGPAATFVAVTGDTIVGSYFLKANQPGLGAHVANAGFMVAPECSGRGIGRAMGEHALNEARRRGFTAMQFNYVVASNERAVELWKSLGFSIVGRIPQAFQHSGRGLTDVYIMHRFL